MGLFRPIWMTKKMSKDEEAKAAVRKITDNQKLKKIAIKAPRQPVAYEAISRIDDDEILFDFAKKDGLYNEHGVILINDRARELIKSQSLLEKLLSTFEYEDFNAKIIYERTENPPLDWNIRMSGEDAECKLAASVEKLSYPQDEEKLKDVIDNAKTQKGIDIAIEHLPYEENREYYMQILSGNDYRKKKHIVETYPQAQEELLEIALDESNDIQTRMRAGMYAGNSKKAQEFWIDLAMNYWDIYTRMTAASMIKDKSLIPDIQKQRCAEGNHLWVDTGSRRQQYQFGPSSDHRKCIYCGEELHEYFDGD